MVHYFEPPIDTRRAGKRNRAHDNSDSPQDVQDQETNPTFETEDGGDEEIDALTNFPHAPLPRERGGEDEYAAVREQRNVKRQHYIVLNTILHKCLLDQDFVRAGKAFGLLLRFELAGQRVNLRQKGLWGIGAEILLHRPSAGNISNTADEDSIDQVNAQPITNEGFEVARAYYERLILQYPYRKTRPQDVSSQHFYPAMFGLWILQTQTQSQRSSARAQRRRSLDSDGPPQSTSSTHTPSDGNADETLEQQDSLKQRIDTIKAEELEQARAIAARLDEITFLPPFDQDPQLLKLRGMVGLWIADLMAVVDSDSQRETDSQRLSAREHLRRAKAHGWKVTESLSQLVDEDTEPFSE